MKCHEVDYEIIGADLQLVEIELDPNEAVIAEAGAMSYMEEDITYEARMGDGSSPREGIFGKLVGAGKRVLTGESLFMTRFTNNGIQKRKVAFSSACPGSIISIDMAKMGGELICQKDSFLCAALGTRLSIAFTKKFGAGLSVVKALFFKKIEGDGMAFASAGGTLC